MFNHHHHHWVLINVQVQEHIPHQCTLQVNAHRAELTLGKTAICIFVAKFYGRMLFLSPTQTLAAVQDVRLNPTDLGCVLHRCHNEINSALPLDHCYRTGKSVCSLLQQLFISFVNLRNILRCFTTISEQLFLFLNAWYLLQLYLLISDSAASKSQ